MNNYEALLDEACRDGIDVIDYIFESDRIKGLYCDGMIAVSENLDSVEKACTLTEELGHHHTTVGNILDLSVVQNRKQERQARLWAYNKRIGLRGLIQAYEQGCKSQYEIAEFLNVTDDFFKNAIHCYREKYGVYTNVDNYTVYFIPQLAIMKKI